LQLEQLVSLQQKQFIFTTNKINRNHKFPFFLFLQSFKKVLFKYQKPLYCLARASFSKFLRKELKFLLSLIMGDLLGLHLLSLDLRLR
jgi:hypothetical protein